MSILEYDRHPFAMAYKSFNTCPFLVQQYENLFELSLVQLWVQQSFPKGLKSLS